MARQKDNNQLNDGITEDDEIILEVGQRRCGPPSNWIKLPPGKGCEVFIAKIPKDSFEKDLIPIMRQMGEIYMFRLMMEDEYNHRGFGFCIYTSVENAKDAVRKLNNYQIRENWFLGVCFSVDNCRLFVGGIPKLKIKAEILEAMRQVTENVVDIIMYPSASDKNKNRGFAFVEYSDHKSAAVARKKMIVNGIQLWGHNVAVDWAEPERKVDEETMSKVKILYVRNLMLTTSEDTIYHTFSKFTKDDDEIIRVKKIGDFAFVHFKDRHQATIVKDNLNGTNLEGSIIEVHFAKPVNKLEQQQKQMKKNKNSLNTFLPISLTNESRKKSIDGSNSESQKPASVYDNGIPKSYRNAAGRCSIKSKQRIKNNEISQNGYFNHFYELLIHICRHYSWGIPNFTVQIIPMLFSHSESSIQLYTAQVYIPGLNFSFTSKISAFSPDEAILNASESALQWMIYNGIQFPLLVERSQSYIEDHNQKAYTEKEFPSIASNYRRSSDSSLSSNKAGQNAEHFFFQYDSLTRYYTNHFIQSNNSYPYLEIANYSGGESDKQPFHLKNKPKG